VTTALLTGKFRQAVDPVDRSWGMCGVAAATGAEFDSAGNNPAKKATRTIGTRFELKPATPR
jgi:hypothetical protein